jgi:1-acyl-sn-glycerol-3-phosphate acyltransferase
LHWYRKPHLVRKLLRLWSRAFISGARYIVGVNYTIEGHEHISNECAIYMGNHQTAWESIMMTVIFPDVNMVTKAKAMSIPVFGWGLRHSPMIAIDPTSPGKNIRGLLRGGKSSIAEGRNIVIFPEGERVPIGKTKEFSRGFEVLYKHCGVPVVPFVTDSGLWWPSGFSSKYPCNITLRFLAPIEAGLQPDEFSKIIEKNIRAEAKALLSETQ